MDVYVAFRCSAQSLQKDELEARALPKICVDQSRKNDASEFLIISIPLNPLHELAQ